MSGGKGLAHRPDGQLSQDELESRLALSEPRGDGRGDSACPGGLKIQAEKLGFEILTESLLGV